MSSESHHAFLTSSVAVPQTAASTSANQIQRIRVRTIAAAEKYAYAPRGSPSTSMEIARTAASEGTPKKSNLANHQNGRRHGQQHQHAPKFLSVLSFLLLSRFSPRRNRSDPRHYIIRIAVLDAIQLNALCSGSLPIV